MRTITGHKTRLKVLILDVTVVENGQRLCVDSLLECLKGGQCLVGWVEAVVPSVSEMRNETFHPVFGAVGEFGGSEECGFVATRVRHFAARRTKVKQGGGS